MLTHFHIRIENISRIGGNPNSHTSAHMNSLQAYIYWPIQQFTHCEFIGEL